MPDSEDPGANKFHTNIQASVINVGTTSRNAATETVSRGWSHRLGLKTQPRSHEADPKEPPENQSARVHDKICSKNSKDQHLTPPQDRHAAKTQLSHTLCHRKTRAYLMRRAFGDVRSYNDVDCWQGKHRSYLTWKLS